MKRVALIHTTGLVLSEWYGTICVDRREFGTNSIGFNAAQSYLLQRPNTPIIVVTDFVNEQVHVGLIPSCPRRDRQQTLKDYAEKQFPDGYKLRAEVIGHTWQAAKQLIIRVRCFGSDSSLEPWLTLFQRHAISVVGISSVAMLGELLLRRHVHSGSSVLLLSSQQPGQLRQSFYQQGVLKFTRLTRTAELSSKLNAVALNELQSNRRYLEGLGFIKHEQALAVIFLAPDQASAMEFEQALKPFVEFITHSGTSLEVAQKLKFKIPFASQITELIFAGLASNSSRYAQHYGVAEFSPQYRLRIIKRWCPAAAAIICALAGVLSLNFWGQAELYRSYLLSLKQAEQRIDRKIASLPIDKIPEISASQMKRAIQLAEQLPKKPYTTVNRLMSTVAQAVTNNPAVTVLALKWSRQQQIDSGKSVPSNAATFYNIWVDAKIDALSPQHQNVREIMDQFLWTLSSLPKVGNLELSKQPTSFDTGVFYADSKTSYRPADTHFQVRFSLAI